MSDLAKILYERFFMRDVLGKVTPGFIVLLTFLHLFGVNQLPIVPDMKLEGPIQVVVYVIIIPVCYLLGLGLQIFGESFGLHSPSPQPLKFLLVLRLPSWAEAYNEHRNRLSMINTKIADKDVRADVKSQRERFVYLKEGSGNLALAFAGLATALLFKSPDALKNESGTVIGLLFGLAAILEVSHYLHGARQSGFEIRALHEAGVLTDEQSKKMFLRVPRWALERPPDPPAPNTYKASYCHL
ncbi:MAG: hypothetical protein AB1488_09955 [Nitrospirota bacterium]